MEFSRTLAIEHVVILGLVFLWQVGAANNLLIKEHIHTFVNKGGEIGGADFSLFKQSFKSKLSKAFMRNCWCLCLFTRAGLPFLHWSTSSWHQSIFDHKSAFSKLFLETFL